jgi:hypothetical protein
MSELQTDQRLADLRSLIETWLAEFSTDNSLVAAVDRGTSDGSMLGEPRWYVRLVGEEKDFITVWLTLGQRTLRYETYVLPDPPEHRDEILELLLRRNDAIVGAHFSIGEEDAIYLRGEVPDTSVTADELDRVIGTIYTTVEANFRALVRLAFASRFA